MGDRADFQVLLELGPQLNTQPLANQNDRETSKRNIENTLSNNLYALRHSGKNESKGKDLKTTTEETSWLERWSQSVSNERKQIASRGEVQENKKQTQPKPKPGLAVGEIDAKSVIPEDLEW